MPRTRWPEFRKKYTEKSIEFAFKTLHHEMIKSQDLQISDTEQRKDPVCNGYPLRQVDAITKFNRIHGDIEIDRQYIRQFVTTYNL